MLEALALSLGLDAATTAALIPVVILVAQFITKSIPDTATGPMAVVRRVFAMIGIYRKNNTGV